MNLQLHYVESMLVLLARYHIHDESRAAYHNIYSKYFNHTSTINFEMHHTRKLSPQQKEIAGVLDKIHGFLTSVSSNLLTDFTEIHEPLNYGI